jgi:hypothetical protein
MAATKKKYETRMSNKLYPPAAAPASQRLARGDQGISNDEVKSSLPFPSVFDIRYSIFCGLPASGKKCQPDTPKKRML